MPYIFAQKLGQLNAVTHLAKGLGNLAHLFWNQDIAHECFHLCIKAIYSKVYVHGNENLDIQ